MINNEDLKGERKREIRSLSCDKEPTDRQGRIGKEEVKILSDLNQNNNHYNSKTTIYIKIMFNIAFVRVISIVV